MSSPILYRICTPEAVAPTAPNNAVSTATTTFTMVLQFFIISYLLSFLMRLITIRLVIAAATVAACVAATVAVSGLRGVDIVLRRLLYATSADEGLSALTG